MKKIRCMLCNETFWNLNEVVKHFRSSHGDMYSGGTDLISIYNNIEETEVDDDTR